MALRAAVDVGGTKTRVELFRDVSVEEPDLCRVLDTSREGPVLDELAATILELANGEPLLSAAVGCPGPLDSEKGIVLNPPNLSEEWWDLDVSGGLEARLALPVALENDCNLGALGESSFGTGKGYYSILYLTISTGIGAGLVVNGEIFGGSRGLAGEVGHTVVTDGNFPCGCGRNGCLEAVASGTAISREARRRGWRSGFKQDPFTAREIAIAAHEGDVEAREILLEAATYLARALLNFIYAYDPAVVVLGGGVAQSNIFFEMVQRALSAELIMPAFNGILVRRASLRERSVIYGARTLAERLSAQEKR